MFVYTMQPVVQSVAVVQLVWQPVVSIKTKFTRNNLLSNWLKTGLTTGWTTGCIVYTNIQPVVKPVVQPAVQLCSRLDNRLHRVNKHPTGCQTDCTTGLTTGRFDNRLYRVKRALNSVYTIQHVVKPGLSNRYDNRLSNRFDNRLDNRLYRVYKHPTGCQTCWMFVHKMKVVVQPVVQLVCQTVVSCKRDISPT